METPRHEVKAAILGLKPKFDALGKPLGIPFAALDGRPVGFVTIKGQVVLVDFWATR